MAPEQFDFYPGLARSFHDVTLRQSLIVTLPGRRLRVWLSNEFGTRPLVIGAAHIARAATGPTIEPDSDRALTFGGHPGVTIPPGAAVVSDVAELDVARGKRLSVSVHLPLSTEGSTSTVHEDALRTNYVSPSGDFTASESFPVDAELHSYYYLAGVDVEAPLSAGALVALGDSITDGYGATPGAGHTWPDELARRLASHGTVSTSVLNMGIGGNRLLHDLTGPAALARINRDLFAIPAVRFLVILEGINDIGGAELLARPEEEVSADDLTGAFRQLISRAHEHGIKVIGATLTPTGGCRYISYDSPASEAKRQAVNAWIRDSRSFDAVVDFDRAIRDPDKLSRLKPEYDSGDHLHPNDAGYGAMANAFDLSLLR